MEENSLKKIRNEDRWAIYSGSYKIGYVEGSGSHYIGLDGNMEISLQELEDVVTLIKKKFKPDIKWLSNK